jgi:hypothetical protein
MQFLIEHAFVTLSNICSLSSHAWGSKGGSPPSHVIDEHMFGGELLFD